MIILRFSNQSKTTTNKHYGEVGNIDTQPLS